MISLSLSDYYGDGDVDVMSVGGEGAVQDATFQDDLEFYEFFCLSTEETWNYLDSQVQEVSRELKVWGWRNPPVRGRGQYSVIMLLTKNFAVKRMGMMRHYL